MPCLRSLGRYTTALTMKHQCVSFCTLALIWPHAGFLSSARGPEYKPWLLSHHIRTTFLGHASMFCTIKIPDKIWGENFQQEVWSPIPGLRASLSGLPNNTSPTGTSMLGERSKVISHLKVLSKHTLFNSIFCFSVKLPSLCLRSF